MVSPEEIERRLQTLKKRRSPSSKDQPLQGMRLATDLLAAILVGVGVGRGIDVWFECAPWGIGGGLGLGGLTGIWMVVRHAVAWSKKE